MSSQVIGDKVEELWNRTAVEKTIEEYIRIPNQSPAYDAEWLANGLQNKAAELLKNWVNGLNCEEISAELLQDEGKTPLIFIEIKSTIEGELEEDSKNNTVLLYGHFDKQPPLTSDWDEGLHPYQPVYRDGKLYGRGGADDGYSTFSAIVSILALKEQGIAHPRCVVIIEGSEESGSIHLMDYVRSLSSRIGDVRLVICLDSGCGNYDQLWLTTSLRGLIAGTLRVDVLKEGMHSGRGSGVVPSSFRIVRELLSRVEDSKTGEILVPALHGPGIPPYRIDQAKEVAGELGKDYVADCQLVDNTKTLSNSISEVIIGRTWKPTLCVTGVDGIPHNDVAGNVLRPYTSFVLSIRTPPNVSTNQAAQVVKEVLEANPPYDAKVSFTITKSGNGWDSPNLEDWLSNVINTASNDYFSRPARYTGEGGSIPFMGMLADIYPRAQFIITGVLGPFSNAHGPNEFLHLATARRVTKCVSFILSSFAQHK